MSTGMQELECRHCGYKWYPRTPNLPKVCPKCKHRNWNKSPWEVEHEVKKEQHPSTTPKS